MWVIISWGILWASRGADSASQWRRWQPCFWSGSCKRGETPSQPHLSVSCRPFHSTGQFSDPVCPNYGNYWHSEAWCYKIYKIHLGAPMPGKLGRIQQMASEGIPPCCPWCHSPQTTLAHLGNQPKHASLYTHHQNLNFYSLLHFLATRAYHEKCSMHFLDKRI